MLLTSADTKSPSKHEEISTTTTNNNISHSNDDNNNNNNSGGPVNNESSDDMTQSSLVDSERSAEATSDEPMIIAASRSEIHLAAATEPAELAQQQLTQLSVPAEENSAFKSYIEAQSNDQHIHELSGGDEIQHTANEMAAVCRFGNDNGDVDDEMKAAHIKDDEQTLEVRLLVRRREAGALIGKKGANIKRMRDTFRSSMFSIPDTGNGPERVVCITSDLRSIDPILADITRLLMEKSPENDEQVELKLLIHSSHAGSIIGIGGQSIKKLRNDSKAAIKIYEMCCPLSNERVCAIKARPSVVVSTIKLIQSILQENSIKGTIKPYDALHFDLSLVDKYGGYLPEEQNDVFAHNNNNSHTYAVAAATFAHESACLHNQKHYSNNGWPPAIEYCDPCEMQTQESHKKLLAETRAAAFHCMPSGLIQGAGGGGENLKREQAAAVKSDQAETTRSKFYHRHHPNNRSASRFHPYAAAALATSNSCHSSSSLSPYPSHPRSNPRHPSPSALHHYSSTFHAAPYAQMVPIHHFGGGPRANQLASQARMVANQFLYPNGASGSGTCRHMRPCPCVFLPMMHESHHQSAAMLAAYAQVAPLDAGDEYKSIHHQTANEQQRQETSSSPNNSSNNNNNNNDNNNRTK